MKPRTITELQTKSIVSGQGRYNPTGLQNNLIKEIYTSHSCDEDVVYLMTGEYTFQRC